MDELHPCLTTLIDQARAAHDPSSDDARRVAAALAAVIPGFVPASLLVGTAAQSATEVLAHTATGASVKAAWVGGTAAAKLLGALLVAAVVGAGIAVTMKTRPDNHAPRPQSSAVKQQVASMPPADLPSSSRPEVSTDVATAPQTGTTVHVEPPSRSTKPSVAAAHRAPSEIELIEHALSALHAGDIAGAERWLDQHAARFPNGALAQERTGLTLIALCRRGRIHEAEPLRQRFMAEAPQSPLAERVARACIDIAPPRSAGAMPPSER